MSNGPNINKLVESVIDAAGNIISSTVASVAGKMVKSKGSTAKSSTTPYNQPRQPRGDRTHGARTKPGLKSKKSKGK